MTSRRKVLQSLCLAVLLVLSLATADMAACPQPIGNGNGTPPIICIDPGHPSEVSSGMTVQNGTTETHIAWVVEVKLRRLLEENGYKVVMTKSSEPQLVKNKERALIANRAQATLMVRLHCDSSTDRG